MQEPTCIKKDQRLNGMVAALGHLIAKSTERSLPFFKTLRGTKTFEWTTECSSSFKQLKEYLASPPLLSSPIQGESLYVYLPAEDRALAAVLVREKNGLQKPIYLQGLYDVEGRYFNAEKVAYALVVAARNLRAYFSAHPIVVLTNAPLIKILHKPESSGRLLSWSIELTDFDIEYRPRKALHAQPLVEFLVELMFIREDNVESAPKESLKGKEQSSQQIVSLLDDCWKVYSDGSATKNVSGAGIVLIEPETSRAFEEALTFTFQASKNQADYEALITVVEYARCFRATKIIAYCDSQLIVHQVKGKYEVINPILIKYCKLVKKWVQDLEFWEIQRVGHEENELADPISKLATSDEQHGQPISYLEHPTYERVQVLCSVYGSKCWIDEMKAYIETSELVVDEQKARMTRKKSPRFTIHTDALFRRSFVKPLLRCVHPMSFLKLYNLYNFTPSSF